MCYCKDEALIDGIITSWYQIFIYVIISIIASEGYHQPPFIKCLYAVFGYK